MSDDRQHIDFLDALRAIAAWLVVWGHLFAVYPGYHQVLLAPVAWVQETINQPMGITQDFGWFGVCLFFLISGYVITHVAQRESAAAFAIKRVFRIFPMLAVTVLLAVWLEPGPRSLATPWTVLTNITLLNYWMHPQVILVGVAWTLAVEILFYALMLATYPLTRWPVTRTVALLAVVAAVIALARSFGPDFFLFAASAAYLPYLLVGQILYLLVHRRAIGVPTAVALGALTYAVMLFGLKTIHTANLPLDKSYLISFAWALTLFVLAQQVSDRLRTGWLTRWLSDTSYSLYLLHGTIGFSILNALVGRIGLLPALGIAVPAMFACVLFFHVTVEKPSQALGRRLARRLEPGQPPGALTANT